MAVQAFAGLDCRDPARFVQQDAPFRQVKIERPAPFAFGQKRLVGAVEGRDDRRR